MAELKKGVSLCQIGVRFFYRLSKTAYPVIRRRPPILFPKWLLVALFSNVVLNIACGEVFFGFGQWNNKYRFA